MLVVSCIYEYYRCATAFTIYNIADVVVVKIVYNYWQLHLVTRFVIRRYCEPLVGID